MVLITQTVLIILFLSYWLDRGENAFNRWIESRKPVLPPTVEESDPLPDDLAAHAGSFDSDWAKQQTLDGMYELRGRLGDWQKVRAAMGFNSGTI